MVSVIICAVLATACLVYSVFAFQQKGPLLTTMYLIADLEERNKMKTKTEYYFVGSVFLGLSILFATVLIGIRFNLPWMAKLTIGFALVLAVYVLVVFIKNEIRKKY